MKTISIVSPCFNEEDNVERCYLTVKEIFAKSLPGYAYEHIFADNASMDRTVEILRGIAMRDPAVKVIVNARNFGLFRSTFNAIKYTSGDAVLLMLPVDLQDPPELLPEFVNLWEQGYEVVAGARIEREEGLAMRTARRTFYGIVNRLADFEIPENVGEFQLVDRKVCDAVKDYDDQYPYIRGLVASVGFKRIIVPYRWVKREKGKSKLRIGTLMDQALNGIFSFTSAPMRACSLIGVLLSAICIVYAFGIGVTSVLGLTNAPRGTITLIVSLFFLSGIQLLFLGVLGEYVTTIHRQVRGGRSVVEREKMNLDAGLGDRERTAPEASPFRLT